MQSTITITRKGQTTLPAAMRRKLGVSSEGGVLAVRFDERKGEIVISPPASVAELTTRISSYVRPGVTPLVDVSGYYRKHRKVGQ